jgi:hypothetical protein
MSSHFPQRANGYPNTHLEAHCQKNMFNFFNILNERETFVN